MKYLQLSILSATLLTTFASISSAQEVGAPSSETRERRILHLLRDANGQVYSNHHVLDRVSGKPSSVPVRQHVSATQLTRLRELGLQRNTEIRIHDDREFYRATQESASPGLKSSGACALTSSTYDGAITFWVDGNGHHGEGYVSSSSNRADGESTQWVTGTFKSIGYGNSKAHGGIDLLYQSHFNGGGLIFGDRSESTDTGCVPPQGTPKPASAQIEFWAALSGCSGSTCQNLTIGDDQNPTGCSYFNENQNYNFAVHTQGGTSNNFGTTIWIDDGTSYLRNGYSKSSGSFNSANTSASGLLIYDLVKENYATPAYEVYYTNLNCGWF